MDQNVHAMTELFDLSCAEVIKDIELTTNHDVKAIEYYIQARDEIEYPLLVSRYQSVDWRKRNNIPIPIVELIQ